MKCSLIKDMRGPERKPAGSLVPIDQHNPCHQWVEAQEAEYSANGQVKLLVPKTVDVPRPAGTVIEHKDAWKLVRQGVAFPEDDACRNRAGVRMDEIADRQARYEKLAQVGGVSEDDDEFVDEELESDDE